MKLQQHLVSYTHTHIYTLSIMSTKVLADKDVNAAMSEQQAPVKEVKSMEYHRQMLQSKMAQEESYEILYTLLKTFTDLIQDDPVCLALG